MGYFLIDDVDEKRLRRGLGWSTPLRPGLSLGLNAKARRMAGLDLVSTYKCSLSRVSIGLMTKCFVWCSYG
jgi:hypothetical protein